MINQKFIYKLSSLALSAFFIALFIYILPSLLLIIAAIILFLVISSLVMAFLIKKNIVKTSFGNVRTNNENKKNHEEIREMKDVTNSNKDIS